MDIKKQYLLWILKETFDVFDMAEWLYAFVEKYEANDSLIDELIPVINDQIKKASDEWERKKLQKCVDKLKLLKDREFSQLKKDSKEADELLSNI